jgi:hypothetical protein
MIVMQVSASCKIPTVRLRTLYPNLEEIFKEYNERDFTKEELRNTLKINPKSSGLLQKILDFKAFGLLEESNEKLRITNDGKKLLLAKENERLLELQNIVKNIGLWKTLYEQYNTNIDPQNFWNILSRITQLDAESAKMKSDKVLKAYLDDINFALTGNAPYTHNTIARTRKSKTQQIHLIPQSFGGKSTYIKHDEPEFGYTLYSEYGDFSITIKDDLTLNIAKISLEAILKAIQTELDKKKAKSQNGIKDLG